MSEAPKKEDSREKNVKVSERLEEWWGGLHVVYKILLFVFGLIIVGLGLAWVWTKYSPELARFIAYLFGGALLIVQIHVTNRRAAAAEGTAKAMQKTTELTEQGNIAERFKNAIEHLGNDSKATQLGGVYALHHIAVDQENYRKRVFDILCAYIRETTTKDEYKGRENKSSIPSAPKVTPGIEIESILNLLFISEEGHKSYGSFRTQLEHVKLCGAPLIGAEFQNANLRGADFQDAKLYFANLQDAKLWHVNFQGARLVDTNLQSTDLLDADLQGATMIRTNLINAENLTIEQLLEAKTLYKAKLPDGMEEEIRKQKPELLEKPAE